MGPTTHSPEDHTPSTPDPDVGGASPADVEKQGATDVADDSVRSHDLSHDLEEEEDGNLSGVSDISSGSMNREPISPEPSGITGPQTPPPPSGETTPSSGPAGVSDISSDNMESHSADVSETSMDPEGGAESVSPGNEGVRMDEGGVTAHSTDGGLVADGGVPGASTTANDSNEGAGGMPEITEGGRREVGGPAMRRTGDEDEGYREAVVVRGPPPPLVSMFPPEEMESELMRRPPPLEPLMAGGMVAPPSLMTGPPPSPPSAQGTPSKTPGKRKVRR